MAITEPTHRVKAGVAEVAPPSVAPCLGSHGAPAPPRCVPVTHSHRGPSRWSSASAFRSWLQPASPAGPAGCCPRHGLCLLAGRRSPWLPLPLCARPLRASCLLPLLESPLRPWPYGQSDRQARAPRGRQDLAQRLVLLLPALREVLALVSPALPSAEPSPPEAQSKTGGCGPNVTGKTRVPECLLNLVLANFFFLQTKRCLESPWVCY